MGHAGSQAVTRSSPDETALGDAPGVERVRARIARRLPGPAWRRVCQGIRYHSSVVSSEPPRLRLAFPNELPLLVEIDDDAGQLYAEAGLPIELAPEHPFLVAEQARWRFALAQDRVFLAVDDRDRGLGFAALGTLGHDEAAPYLEQLSVRRAAMGRGIGRRLLRRAIAWAGARDASAPDGWLWLTTYAHLRWNRPFYESEGFAVVAEPAWPPAITHHIEEQRACLPDPEQRIAMRRPLRA